MQAVRTGGGGRLRNILLIWSLPLALVGWLIEAVFILAGWRLATLTVPGQSQARALWIQGPVATWMVRRGWSGTTVGWSVLYWVAPSHHMVYHEARHVQQAVWFGPLLPVLYLLCLALYGYRESPFERDARKAAVEA